MQNVDQHHNGPFRLAHVIIAMLINSAYIIRIYDWSKFIEHSMEIQGPLYTLMWFVICTAIDIFVAERILM